MRLNQGFKNVLSYSAGMNQWVRNNYPTELDYSFASDFAIADWISGKKGVLETYDRVKKEWLNNYKAFTQAAVAINMLSWAHYQLKRQGYEGRDIFIELSQNSSVPIFDLNISELPLDKKETGNTLETRELTYSYTFLTKPKNTQYRLQR